MKEETNTIDSSTSTCPVQHERVVTTQSNSTSRQHQTSTTDTNNHTKQNLFSFLSWESIFPNSSSSTSNISTTITNDDGIKSSVPTTTTSRTSTSQCPVLSSTGTEYTNSNIIPPSIEEAARYAQTPQPDQTIVLNTDRQVSSIPRGSVLGEDSVKTNSVPDHQFVVNENNQNHENNASNNVVESKWVYPSEQQMYNAMKKKGWTNVPEESIPVVLQIHNHINERTWELIKDWENIVDTTTDTTTSTGNENNNNTTTPTLQLVRFHGRPNDLSPKAFILCKLLHLNELPFDRHDWYVQKQEQQQKNTVSLTDNSNINSKNRIQRYVIDYYYMYSSTNPNMPPIPHMDVRPAFDNIPHTMFLYTRRFLQTTFPGITSYIKNKYNNNNNKRSN